MDKDLSKRLEYVLVQLFKKRETEPFREPVDYEAFGLLDYPNIIKRMMDLGTIRRNLKSDTYKYLESAFEDIQLVWDNCKLYNVEDSMIHKTAVKLEKITESLLKEQFEDLIDQSKGQLAKRSDEITGLVVERQEEFYY
jgi:histone acetyltransferase